MCAAPAQACQEGAVRLVNGTFEQEGRVEVCIGGIWGSMCFSTWSNPSANRFVVCNQLGHRNLSKSKFKANCHLLLNLQILIYSRPHTLCPSLVLVVDQYLEGSDVRAGSRILVNATTEPFSTHH